MSLLIRPAQCPDIYHLYQQIPEFSARHNLAQLSERLPAEGASLLVADIAGQSAGFKVGYPLSESVFYSWLGGVLPAYRRQGVAQALLQAQEQWVAERGYRQLKVKTRNGFPAMLMMLIRNGYHIEACEPQPNSADNRLHLVKTLR